MRRVDRPRGRGWWVTAAGRPRSVQNKPRGGLLRPTPGSGRRGRRRAAGPGRPATRPPSGCRGRGRSSPRLRVGRRVRPVPVRRPDHPPPDAPAGQEHRLHQPPVVAAGQLVLRLLRHLRRPPELPGHHDECRVQQPALGEVIEQRRHRLVRRREEFLLEVWEGVAVGIPRLVVAQVHLHQRHPRLHQPGGDQQRPPEGVAAVPVEVPRRGAGEVEDAAQLRVGQQRHRVLPGAVEPVAGRVQRRPLAVELPQHAEPVADPLRVEPGRQGEVRRRERRAGRGVRPLEVVELVLRERPVRLRLVGGHLEEPRVAAAAHQPAELARDDPAVVLHDPVGQHDGRRQVVPRGGQRPGHGRDGRPVGRLRPVAVEPGRQLRPAGEHHVVAVLVVRVPVGQRPHQRPPVRPRGQQREVFADVDAGRAGRDRLELAADSGRRIWLGVEAVVLAEPAGQEDVDDRRRRSRGGRVGGRPQELQLAHPETEQADRPRLHGGAAGDGRVAERDAGGHGEAPPLGTAPVCPPSDDLASEDGGFRRRHSRKTTLLRSR